MFLFYMSQVPVRESYVHLTCKILCSFILRQSVGDAIGMTQMLILSKKRLLTFGNEIICQYIDLLL